MKPTETWRKNNWRYDLRKYTRVFEEKFKVKREKNVSEAGKVYAITYKISSDFLTDKHHVTPVIVSFGRFRDEEGKTYVRGLNLLFLKTHQCLEILEDAHRFFSYKPDRRAEEMIKLHEKYIKIYPYLFKNFEERRILTQSEVTSEDWGMIPLLHKNLWGTFNSVALDESFQEENKSISRNIKKRPKPVKKAEENSPKQEEFYENLISEEGEPVDLD
jgi:hypothetical protein